MRKFPGKEAGPLYVGASPLTGNATTLVASYCAATSTVSTRYIDDVLTVGNITNIKCPQYINGTPFP